MIEENDAERRRVQRRSGELFRRYLVRLELDDLVLEGRALNISEGGLGVLIPAQAAAPVIGRSLRGSVSARGLPLLHFEGVLQHLEPWQLDPRLASAGIRFQGSYDIPVELIAAALDQEHKEERT
ncbi:MAG: PilZ domain-containing protein [Leptospirales bacterium]|nr:PilZ domain-containing protein [Leptospirales bacterium]